MHGWANIDLIMYWKKRESTRVEKIGIQNFDNTLTCDCDIQLGQFPPQLPLEMYLFRYMEFIIGLQKLSNFPHLILYFLIIYIKGPVVVKLQEDSLDFNCELLCVCNFSSNLFFFKWPFKLSTFILMLVASSHQLFNWKG